MKLPTLLLPTLCAAVTALNAAEPVTLKLWPDGPPTAQVPESEETTKMLNSTPPNPNRVTHVTDPTITLFPAAHPDGSAVIVAPGGGYRFLSYAHEGAKVCEWLNTLGITGILLKYRTPTRDEKDPSVMPVQDAQRAIGLARHHATEWGLNPKRIGLLGFSAGGNLTGHVAWDRGPRSYTQDPKLDDPNGPDFIVFVYGGGFVDTSTPGQYHFKPGFTFPADAPPAFFVVAHDDKTNPIEATLLYLEYKKHNIPAELHIMTKGGHGFGMRDDKNPINQWPQRCGEWLKTMGY